MKQKFIQLYNDFASRVAKMSHAQRLQVGAVIVKDDRVVSMGYNGMPAGWENNCEDREYMDRGAGGWLNPDEIEEQWPFTEWSDTDQGFTKRYRLKTKPEVLHAETNAIAKLARSTESGVGADLFVTHSPCLDCAKLIYQSGINRVYYGKDYRDDAGIRFLKQSGVQVTKVEEGLSLPQN
jgi:dCMP deaminase